jgi:formylglycine-generating enzyme required for sulfatase activity
MPTVSPGLSRLFLCASAAVVASAFLSTASAAPGADGFDWATIGAVGNAAYTGPGPNSGRGRVSYQYKISKLEITTSQWLEFTNTFSTQTDAYNFTKLGPLYWGATFDPTYIGPGVRYRLRQGDPNAGMRPVGGISWRDAARYCNWLHNGKSSSLASLTTGAYDTTTFGGNRTTGYTDAATHLPGAKYWIPTLDEWMKAAYYDPDRFGNGVGGWWEYTNRSNQQGVSGLPGVGTTSAGLRLDFSAEWTIPLGAYSSVTSPWGLWDTSGGATEWTEEWAGMSPLNRLLGGAAAGDVLELDGLSGEVATSFDPERLANFQGLRLASRVPSPSTCVFIGVLVAGLSRRKR